MSISPRSMWWRLDARNKPGLLWALMDEFQTNSKVSLEGHLQGFDLLGRSDASTEETSALKRNTIYPVLDFVVLPITADVKAALKKSLSSPGIFGRDGTLVHVQIERDDELVFGAYDQFHKDCVEVHAPEELLAKLHCKGILRAYQHVT